MVCNSAKLDRRTKQHTQFGVSASNGPRDMARTKSWRKKKWTRQTHIASPTEIANNRTSIEEPVTATGIKKKLGGEELLIKSIIDTGLFLLIELANPSTKCLYDYTIPETWKYFIIIHKKW